MNNTTLFPKPNLIHPRVSNKGTYKRYTYKLIRGWGWGSWWGRNVICHTNTAW